MVDVVVSTIVSALLSGLSSGGVEATHAAVVDAYKALRDRLSELTGGDDDIAAALNNVETQPKSPEAAKALKQLLVEKNVSLDEADIDRLALALREAVRNAQQPVSAKAGRSAQIVTGDYNATTSGTGSATVTHNVVAHDPQRRGLLSRLFGR